MVSAGEHIKPPFDLATVPLTPDDLKPLIEKISSTSPQEFLDAAPKNLKVPLESLSMMTRLGVRGLSANPDSGVSIDDQGIATIPMTRVIDTLKTDDGTAFNQAKIQEFFSQLDAEALAKPAVGTVIAELMTNLGVGRKPAIAAEPAPEPLKPAVAADTPPAPQSADMAAEAAPPEQSPETPVPAATPAPADAAAAPPEAAPAPAPTPEKENPAAKGKPMGIKDRVMAWFLTTDQGVHMVQQGILTMPPEHFKQILGNMLGEMSVDKFRSLEIPSFEINVNGEKITLTSDMLIDELKSDSDPTKFDKKKIADFFQKIDVSKPEGKQTIENLQSLLAQRVNKEFLQDNPELIANFSQNSGIMVGPLLGWVSDLLKSFGAPSMITNFVDDLAKKVQTDPQVAGMAGAVLDHMTTPAAPPVDIAMRAAPSMNG